MDEKELSRPFLADEADQSRPRRQAGVKLPMPAILLLALGAVYGLFQGLDLLMMPTRPEISGPMYHLDGTKPLGASKIPLEAHIMYVDANNTLRHNS